MALATLGTLGTLETLGVYISLSDKSNLRKEGFPNFGSQF